MSKCYMLNMTSETAQFFEKICKEKEESTETFFLNYRLGNIKSYLDKNRKDIFDINITGELINSFYVSLNYNDRLWSDFYKNIFWLLQTYEYKVRFTEITKNQIGGFFDPFKKDLLHYHPPNITDEEIKTIMEGITFINLNETSSIDSTKDSYCIIS